MGLFKELKDDIIDIGTEFIQDEFLNGYSINGFRTKMQYPLDELEYKASVQFRTIKEEPFDVAGLLTELKQLGGGVLDAYRQISNTEGGALAAIAGTFGGGSSTQLGQQLRSFFQGDFEPPAPRAAFEYNDPKVTLYLNQALQFRNSVQYNQMNLGTLGASTEAALQSGAGFLGAAGAGVAGVLKGAMGDFGAAAGTDLARLGVVAGARLLGTQAGGAFRNQLRTTLNPNTRALFDFPHIRTFAFDFVFTPVSKKEASVVNDIVKYFQTELYPTSIVAGDTGVSLGYNFPSKFDIKVMYNGSELPNMKILPSYLQEVNITYNPAGMGMFEDGNHNQIGISLLFMEVRALHKGDITGQGANVVDVERDPLAELRDGNENEGEVGWRFGLGRRPSSTAPVGRDETI